MSDHVGVRPLITCFQYNKTTSVFKFSYGICVHALKAEFIPKICVQELLNVK